MIKPIKQRSLLIAVFFVSFFLNQNVIAQVSGGLYLLPDNYEAQIINPAFMRTDEAQILAFPGFGGLTFNNSANVSLSDLIYRPNKGNVFVDLERFNKLAPETNHISQSLSVPLIYYTLPINNGQFSFYIKEQVYNSFYVPKSAIVWFNAGNFPENYRVYNTGKINVNSLMYNEIAFSVSKKNNEYISFGLRGKLISGRSYVNLQDWNYKLATSANGKEIQLNSKGSGVFSLPANIRLNENNQIEKIRTSGILKNYLATWNNPGLAVDFGVVFNLYNLGEFSASISDIGFVFFRNNSYKIEQNKQYLFTGFDVSNSLDAKTNGYISPYNVVISTQDKMADVLLPDANSISFSKLLFPKVFLQYKYNLENNYKFGISNQSYFQKQNFRNLFTLSVLKNWEQFSVFGNTTLHGINQVSLGGGFQWTNKYSQLFFATDNFLALYHPASQKNYTVSLGMNLLLNYYPPGKTAKKSMPLFRGKTSNFHPFFRKRK